MLSLIRKLLGRESYPLNEIYISKQRLVDNYKHLSSLNPNIKLAPVLKSNAYGHGIEIVGKVMDELNPPFICVDSLYEAYRLLKAGVNTEILITGYIHPKSLQVKKLPFSYTVFDFDQLAAIDSFQKGSKVHLFFDTGMHREGFDIRHIKDLMRRFKKYNNVVIDGVMSHLALSDNPISPITRLQINNFKAAKLAVLQMGYNPTWFHLGGSLALTNKLGADCNLIRSGKSIYGFPQTLNGKPSNLKPALKMTTKIAQWKYIYKGDYVGYSGTFRAPRDMILGILPIGYNDGVDRRLSNKGVVMVKPTGFDSLGPKRSKVYDKLPEKAACRIIGLVSMNVTTIDLTAAQDILGNKIPGIGEEVEIFSDNPEDPNSFENSAKACGTIPLELLVHLNPATRRELI